MIVNYKPGDKPCYYSILNHLSWAVERQNRIQINFLMSVTVHISINIIKLLYHTLSTCVFLATLPGCNFKAEKMSSTATRQFKASKGTMRQLPP